MLSGNTHMHPQNAIASISKYRWIWTKSVIHEKEIQW